METKFVQEVIVSNRAGIHTRVGLKLFQTMKEYAASARLFKGSISADMKSVMELLSLGAAQGEKLRLEVEGDDAQAAMKAVVALFDAKFYEDQNEE